MGAGWLVLGFVVFVAVSCVACAMIASGQESRREEERLFLRLSELFGQL